MYANGEGVPEDNVLAYTWWNLAVAQGDEDAQENKVALTALVVSLRRWELKARALRLRLPHW
jgi:TPR repeat protein